MSGEMSAKPTEGTAAVAAGKREAFDWGILFAVQFNHRTIVVLAATRAVEVARPSDT